MAVRKDQRSQSSPVAAWLRDAVEKDPALGRMLEQLERAASGDEPAVLVGPRGCGLERAARGIHFLSRRAPEAVFTVACGELLEASAEAELFGFDGGGHPPRVGLIERAGADLDPADRNRRVQQQLLIDLVRDAWQRADQCAVLNG